ncbi:NUDIX hydrolase [Streptomyces sodiiphilus]|uniref:NUDIX hydrolase n=1 Tax=Streptomyces sodiiphilus TaxID=226217 RepID=A0ABN2PW58_9ACTN
MHNESDFTSPPDRRVGGLALFRNGTGAVLLVEKKYRTGLARWGLVGGSAKPGEPAAIACQREILEETGLKVVPERLLAVHYMPAAPPVREGFNFVFDAGILPDDTAITLPEDELASYGWAAPDELPGLVAPYTGWRITSALNALAGGPVRELVGHPPDDWHTLAA